MALRSGGSRSFGPVLLAVAIATVASASSGATFRVLGWNNLGMHCMDDRYDVFSLLPPYNTLEIQLVRDGALVTSATGINVTYHAVPDPDGSINTTSSGKTGFWNRVTDLFGVVLPVDAGLAGNDMPGPSNTPRSVPFDATRNVWSAPGIPITPYDDARQKNPYPLMRVEARDAGTSALLAQLDVVLPVSDEMNCRGCHASGSSVAAQPLGGWINDPDPGRDHRLNILRLHDEKNQFNYPNYAGLLTDRGYDAAGLLATVQVDGKAVLCASCHASEALSGSGVVGISTLTRAIHTRHARVRDPVTLVALGDSGNRSACYNCHPGSVTRCLRGAMGSAVASDGTLAMQCQSCHGQMKDVAALGRAGWLDEPACQNCHTGTAVNNNGEIRYTDAFDSPGVRRVAVDATFATTPNVPTAPYSLYRFSTGHGGLLCEACHDSTHAESPSSHRNDNLKAVALQGHEGMISNCATCHTAGVPATVDGGPHGMHPIGNEWVGQHGDVVGQIGSIGCQNCHGADYRGSVLSRAQQDIVVGGENFGAHFFWRGFQVSCFACHDGPTAQNASPNTPAFVADANAVTTRNIPVAIPLSASDANGDPLVLRVVKQPDHGTVGLVGTIATYYPEVGFLGAEQFTFAAWDGSTDSNLAVANVTVPEADPTAAGLAALCAIAAAGPLTARARRRAPGRSPSHAP